MSRMGRRRMYVRFQGRTWNVPRKGRIGWRVALRCVGDMEAYWTYALSTDMADFVHCEPRWYSTRVIALRMGGMQQYGISVSIFEQGNLQGNSSGPSDPPGLVVCLFLLFPPGAFRRLGWLSIY